MELEKIYELLKNVSIENFYIPSNLDTKFVLKEDISVTISKIEEDKRFGYDYFFDSTNNPISLNDDYDKLIKKLCEHKDFPETYNNITLETWAIKYNNTAIYTIDCFTISNLSSLHVSLPCSIKAYDFIYNFCEILNSHMSGSTHVWVEQDLNKALTILDSSYEDFLNYR